MSHFIAPTNTKNSKAIYRHPLSVVGLALLALGALSVTAALAAETDISNQPLATRPNVSAKPNLLFILDDSGSMNLSYMPDDLGVVGGTDSPYSNWFGYWSAQCNGLAYDPATTYTPPVDDKGKAYAAAGYPTASNDGYLAKPSTTDLSKNYYYVYNSTGRQAKMGWTYPSGSVDTGTDFYKECSQDISKGSTVFDKVLVSNLSAKEQQNYANWFSYYRKRYLLMRTAMGQAMARLDSGYRVGFSRINKDTVQASADFRDVKDFDQAQKTDFYSSLYGASPSGSTPLRLALSKAGRYFANKATDQSYDPVQYSCQRNFALLSTDGYWNGSYGLDLNGDRVGQQDGTEDRPMRDETVSTQKEVVTHTAPATQNLVATSSRTRTVSRNKITIYGTKGQGNCSSSQYRKETQAQRRTDTEVTKTLTPQSGTATYTTTTTKTDGTVTAGPTDGPVTTGSWINTPGGTPVVQGPTVTTGSFADNGSVVRTCVASAGNGVATYDSEVTGNWSNSTNASPSTSDLQIGVYTDSAPAITVTYSGGTANTLADVAQYYYKTDLRDSGLSNCTSGSSGENVCSNIVPEVGADTAKWQHMNTYTIGLGVSGTLPYDRNYLTQTAGSYVNLKSGAVKWPRPDGYNQSDGSGGNATNVDDLWHAAVNGRGQYYSALNATALADAINGVVNSVDAVAGAAAAAATSSVDLLAGDSNLVFRASYTTKSWTGDLQAFNFNGTSGAISATATWSAQSQLDTAVPASRSIYFNNGGSLASFTYDNLSANQKGYFDNICLKAGQCTGYSDADKATANAGSNLVNYLRGVRTFETTSTAGGAVYRAREHVLGDLISGAPVRVGKPPFSYGDAGYADFVLNKANRKPVVYVGSNDGMLHAFSADPRDGGAELWAFVPTAVMSKLYRLADKNYSANHQYFVDGAPVMADIKVGTTWKTILVAGLGAGGSAYYALDITNPTSPSLLWEFTDTNLGLSMGNPVIGKLPSNGTWIVAFASGYNNTGGDGKGHLYVLNAATGVPILSNTDGTARPSIATTAGSTASPSGLAKINAWVTSRTNNTIERIYGGDLEGNLWRFDIDNQVAPNKSALLLAKLQTGTSTPQPITTKPELAKISNKVVVMVGTGRYLGTTDIDSTAQQSVYAIKDKLENSSWGDVRADTANFVRQTLSLASATASTATVTDLAVDWASKGGWWVDLPHSRERVATNMALLGGTLMVGSAIPSGDACTTGGSSWFYGLDATNGGVVNSNTPAGQKWSDTALIAGQTLVRDANGNRRNLVTDTAGNIRTQDVGGNTSGLGSARRSSWRELIK